MAFAVDEVEDGTGLSTALVYEDVATVAAWLSRRGKLRFASVADPEEQEALLVRATAALEDVFALHFRGKRKQRDQGLLWPAYGAIGNDGREYRVSEVPVPYKQAIRLIVEEMASGSYLPEGGSGSAGVKRYKGGPSEAEWFQGSDRSSLIHVHTPIWRLAKQALPPEP